MTADATPEIRTFAGLYTYDRLNRLRGSRRSYWSDNAFGPPTDNLASEYTYDPNGNIQTLTRRNATGSAFFDNFTYQYEANTNKLDWLSDASGDRFTPSGTGAGTDIPQGVRQYDHDAAGYLKEDGGRTITWTPYGKVETVQKETGAGEVRFIYDAQGNRVLKEETGAGGVVSKRTWYVRDAAGQHLTTYEQSGGSGTPRAKEYLLYGSSRLGTAYADNANGGAPVSGALYRRVVGQKQYELADHLGNVRATVGDIKVRSGSTFVARVESYTEYFPFGMVASTATVAGGVGGRFGFNGREVDNDISPSVAYGERDYNPDIIRWIKIDGEAHSYPEVSPYSFTLNSPFLYREVDGNYVESTVDVGSFLLGMKSFSDNLKQKKYFGAAIDVIGMTLDGAAIALPGVPGIAGITIKVIRSADVGSLVPKILQITFRGRKILSYGSKVEASNFSNTGRLRQHFKDHAEEFGDRFKDKYEYLKGAQDFFQKESEDIIQYTRKDGDIVKYDMEANEFGVVTKDGIIRTFFKPEDGAASLIKELTTDFGAEAAEQYKKILDSRQK